MKNKKIYILIAAVIAISVFMLFFNKETVQVSTMNTYIGSVTRTIEVSGSINSDSVEIIPIEANVNVLNIYVKENDYVEKNQKLAELDTEELNITLEKTKLNLEELKANLNNISNDKSKAILSSNALIRSNENYTKLSKDLEIAKEDLKKAETLYNEEVISKAEYDRYEQSVNDVSSMLKTAELNLNDTNINYKESEEQKAQDIQSLERQIKSLNLDIESISKKINDNVIYSSTNGVITEFPLEQDSKTLSGQRIVIYSTDNYEFISNVAQKDAVLIREGQKSIIEIDGVSTQYDGIVSQVSKSAQDDNTGSQLPKVEIKIKISNPDDYIAFGYEGEAKIIIDSKEDTLIVKNESIKTEEDNKFVYVLQGNSAIKKIVKLGLTDGYITSIEEGLQENDLVIVNPPYDLTDGIQIKSAK